MKKLKQGIRKRLRRGFTLIELLTAMGIIGILAVAVLVVINPVGQIQKAHDAQRKLDLHQVANALQLFYEDHNAYPDGSPGDSSMDATAVDGVTQEPDVDNYSDTTGPQGVSRWGRSWNPYMALVPKDPLSGGIGDQHIHYEYVPLDPANPGGPDYRYQGYCVYSILERGIKDPDACTHTPGKTCGHIQAQIDAGTNTGPNWIHCQGDPPDAQYCLYAVCSSNETP